MTDKYVEKQHESGQLTNRLHELAEFFRDTDTEPICIDSSSPKSIDKGIEQLSDRINDAARNKDGNDG